LINSRLFATVNATPALTTTIFINHLIARIMAKEKFNVDPEQIDVSGFTHQPRRKESDLSDSSNPEEKETVDAESLSIETSETKIADKEAISSPKTNVNEVPIAIQGTKRTSSRQKKADYAEYQATFLQTPKIVNAKPLFISLEKKEALNRIARLLGDEKLSPSGLVENILHHHLEMYKEDIELWRKL
jgi:hypothetical protein